MPFGALKSLLRSCNFPPAKRYMPSKGNSFLGSWSVLRKPKGGSVKERAVVLVEEAVRAVQPFALVFIGQVRALAIFFQSLDGPVPMLAINYPALSVECDSVRADQRDVSMPIVKFVAHIGSIRAGKAALLQEHGAFPVGAPLIDHVRGDVAEKQKTSLAVANPNPPFDETETIHNF